MKKVKFNEKDYQVPENWGEVTLSMLIRASKLSELLPNAPLVAVISSYTGIPTSELNTSKTSDVSHILGILDFISTPYEPTPINYFDFKGERYTCEEELVNQSFGDWVSIQTILYNNRETPVNGLARMLSVLCKKDGETIDDIKLDDRENLLLELPMTDAKNLESFFLFKFQEYKNVMLLSSIQEDQKLLISNKLKELNNTMKVLQEQSGTSLRVKLLIGYYRIYLWYIKSLLVQFFNSTPSKQSKRTLKSIWKKFLLNKLGRNKSSQ